MVCSSPGSSVHGILQARIIDWVALSVSRILYSSLNEETTFHWSVYSLMDLWIVSTFWLLWVYCCKHLRTVFMWTLGFQLLTKCWVLFVSLIIPSRECCALNCSVLSNWLWPPWTTSHQASLSVGILHARILEWVAMPSSRGSSQPRDQTQVSLIAGGFFTDWAPREAPGGC